MIEHLLYLILYFFVRESYKKTLECFYMIQNPFKREFRKEIRSHIFPLLGGRIPSKGPLDELFFFVGRPLH